MNEQFGLVKKRILLFVYLSFVFSIVLFRSFMAQANGQKLVLENVSAIENKEFFELNLVFNKNHLGDNIQVQFGNELLMIDVPADASKVDKKRHVLNKDFVKSIYSYVPANGLTRHNIRYQNIKPQLLAGLTTVIRDEKSLKIRIKHPSSEQIALAASDLPVATENIAIEEAHALLPHPPLMLQVDEERILSQDLNESKENAAKSDLTAEIQTWNESRNPASDKAGGQQPAFAQAGAEAQETKIRSASGSLQLANNEPSESQDPQAKPKTGSQAQESELPAFKNKMATQKASSQGMDPVQKIMITLILVGVSGLAIFWQIKKRALAINKPSSLMQIKVLTQHHLGPKKSLLVVRVAGESLLIGVTDQNISLIKGLSLLDEDLSDDSINPPNRFADSLKAQAVPDVQDKNHLIKGSQSVQSLAPAAAVFAQEGGTLNQEVELPSLQEMVQEKLKNMRPI